MNDFAEYIEQFRRDPGLSSRELAGIMGVSEAGLENFLSGYVPPSQRAMSRLVSALALLPEEGAVLPPDRLPFETVSLPSFAGYPAVEVRDCALAEEGISPGAKAILRPCGQPAEGDVLLALVDGQRRLMVCASGAEGPVLRDGQRELPLSGVEILGCVAAVRRELE